MAQMLGVITKVKQSQLFSIASGVHQGCVIALYAFVTVVDWWLLERSVISSVKLMLQFPHFPVHQALVLVELVLVLEGLVFVLGFSVLVNITVLNDCAYAASFLLYAAQYKCSLLLLTSSRAVLTDKNIRFTLILFVFSDVDNNAEYDALEQLSRDAEDKYFNDEDSDTSDIRSRPVAEYDF